MDNIKAYYVDPECPYKRKAENDLTEEEVGGLRKVSRDELKKAGGLQELENERK